LGRKRLWAGGWENSSMHMLLPVCVCVGDMGVFTVEMHGLQAYGWSCFAVPVMCLQKFIYLFFKMKAGMKKNEILSFAGKWMELENIILSEVSQAQKTKNRMFSLYSDFRSRAKTTRGLDFDHMMR
jgi:hypothetical protein